MSAEEPIALEADPHFPSGPWTGFFQQWWIPGRHTTNLELTFQNGELWGEGWDIVGPYSMRGTYDAPSGQCQWTKQYHGRHSVSYKGHNEGKGIWGAWEIRQLFGLYRDRGVFHIWPLGQDPGDEADHTYAAGWPRPAAVLGFGLVILVSLLVLGLKLMPLLEDLFGP